MILSGKPDCNLESDSLIEMFEDSFRRHYTNKALYDYRGESFSYSDMAEQIARMHILFKSAGIQPKDKIAICGKNSSRWTIAFFAIVTYGAVAVPILHDFKPDNIHRLVNHSEAKLLFAGPKVWPGLDAQAMPLIQGAMLLADFSLPFSRSQELEKTLGTLDEAFAKSYPNGFSASDIKYTRESSQEDLAILNYTSGTTSDPKGVMIPYRAVMFNLKFGCANMPLTHEHTMVAILPLAHMFGLAYQVLFEMAVGTKVCFLTKMPTPRMIFEAFSTEKPKLILAVPLIIEKVIISRIFPIMETRKMKILTSIPIIRGIIYKKVRKQIIEAFGGEMEEFIVGGAALNSEVERFLHKIKFPYTVGFGTTETAPLISYTSSDKYRFATCGQLLPGLEYDILSPDSKREAGEILIKGPNVMLGYYKNPEATAVTLDKDGWFHTGDMGVVDSHGFLSIRGRCKNMILGPSGQNIYPEEIEAMLDHRPFVVESLVVSRSGKLVALVLPDREAAREQGMKEEELAGKMEQQRQEVNALLPKYSQLSAFELRQEPFARTPKSSIRRFMYK